MQISYEMVSNAHVRQLTVFLSDKEYFYLPLDEMLVRRSEAYLLEAFNFPYMFQNMPPIITDQWKSLF